MKRIFQILLVFIGLTSFGQQAKENINPNQIDVLIEKGLKDWNVAGMSIIIVKDDAVIYNRGFGHKDVNLSQKVTPKTLFAMGSSAKAFTGALIAQADTDSILKIDEPISTQTSFELVDDYLTKNVTFKDLLTHSSGIPGHDFIWISQQMDRPQLFQKLKHLPKNKGLRQNFQYNNILYAIAGFSGAQIMNTTWEEAIQRKLFDPLGMNSSGFEIPNLTDAKDHTAQFLHNGSIYIPLPFRDLSLIAPAGGIYTNSTDLGKWLIMLLNNGSYNDKQVLDEKTLKKMFHPYVVSIFPRKFEEHFYENYGLGWAITNYRGLLHIHHAGNIDGFTSTVDLWPDQNIGIAILTNTAYANNFTDVMKYEILDHLLKLDDIDWNKRYQDLIADKKAAQSTNPKTGTEKDVFVTEGLDFDKYIGSYTHNAYGTIIVKRSGKNLTAQYGVLPMQLAPLAEDTFVEKAVVPGQEFKFVTDAKGKITGLKSEFPSSITEIMFIKTN